PIFPSLRFAASGNASQDCREERFRLCSLLQACPPCGRLAGAEPAGLHGAIQRSLVEPLVDGEPGRSTEAQGVRDNSHVARTNGRYVGAQGAVMSDCLVGHRGCLLSGTRPITGANGSSQHSSLSLTCVTDAILFNRSPQVLR